MKLRLEQKSFFMSNANPHSVSNRTRVNPEKKSKSQWPVHIDNDQPNDLFTVEKSFAYAGRHLLLDCWNASELNNVDLIEQSLRDAAMETGDSLLHIHLHKINQNGGVSGVAVMARSQITVITMPERDYAAVDILACGDSYPELAIPVFRRALRTENIDVNEHLRGRQFNDLSPKRKEDKLDHSDL